MQLTPLTALSPLDGRYHEKLNPLRHLLSEYGLIFFRVKVELAWLIYLSDHPEITEISALSQQTRAWVEQLLHDFNLHDAETIKHIEKTTNHDVKAIEYFLQNQFKKNKELKPLIPFIHFACTSEDINNLALALILIETREKHVSPELLNIIQCLESFSLQYAALPMLSRTHGQAASPTTLGKEMANFVYRLKKQIKLFNAVEILGKMNGAVGNFNAHTVAYPALDWLKISQDFVTQLGLHWNPYTTQIEPHDYIVDLLQSLIHINNILINLARDIWAYISLGYFQLHKIKEEVGSSTMPHKVNPIDFENAEGNLGLANALATHLVNKLPITRWQRDLTDSTVLRNLGSIFGYTLIACSALLKGLKKIQPNPELMQHELSNHWEILGEAVQTVLRRFGDDSAYERIKTLTHGKTITETDFYELIEHLPIPPAAKTEIRQLTPLNYLGLAVSLATKINEPKTP